MFRLLSILFIITLVCCRCASSSVTTTWKDPNAARLLYNKILVVAVIQDTNISFRKSMEDHLVEDLKQLGYRSVSAMQEFGPNGLVNVEQEATYVKLCGRGIDAVLTIALLDKKKESNSVKTSDRYSSSIEYYNRVWNYRNIAANLMDSSANTIGNKRFFWETMLFDLSTLSPVYLVKTRSFPPPFSDAIAHDYGRLIVGSMLRKKVVKAQPVSSNTLQAF
ncbi:MAG TPA: hypothetical protein VEZ55_07370 [Chitinophagaceae bacterium]|jgi:hypothetical protein|nr:hypothetical protein [Chitinophagaceae bacterium]